MSARFSAPGTAVTDRAGLSSIAYGFMASKALFAGLEIDLFTHLSVGARTVTDLSSVTGVPVNRLKTLLTALTALGLVTVDDGRYANAPASERDLVRGAPGDFGDYFRLQIARQIYPALLHLDEGLAGTGTAFDTAAGLVSLPSQARTFIDGQHAGSRGAARVLAERLPLAGARSLLDVGGGSGAFSIALCQAHSGLHAAVMDLPAVIDVARDYRERAGLAERITLLVGDAVHSPWPPEQDVVLLSYLLSALGADELDIVLAKARQCLRPGGLLVVHDFMLDDDTGPALAALWFLQYLAYRGDAESFSAEDLSARIRGHGFAVSPAEVLIPQITRVVVGRKESLAGRSREQEGGVRASGVLPGRGASGTS